MFLKKLKDRSRKFAPERSEGEAKPKIKSDESSQELSSDFLAHENSSEKNKLEAQSSSDKPGGKSGAVNLLEGPIMSAIGRLAMPIMMTAFLQMAYSLVDMIWIGRLGTGPVAGVGTVGSLLWFSDGILMLSRMGGQVLTARHFGARDQQRALGIARSSLHMSFYTGLTVAIAYVVFRYPLISFFRLPEASTVQYAIDYLIVICIGLPFSFLGRMLTSLSNAGGNSKLPFWVNAAGLVFNMVLDPILIFVFDQGVKGAALATVISQLAVFLIMAYKVLSNPMFKGIPLFKKAEKYEIDSILRLGIPPAMQSLGYCFCSMVLSRMVAPYGEEAISAQKIGSQIEGISWLTAEGFSTALTAFISQNYGAGNLYRAKKGYLSAYRLMLGIGILNTAILYFGAAPIYQIFLPDEAALAAGVAYLRVLAVSQTFMCIEIMVAAAFNGFGKTLFPSLTVLAFAVMRIPIAYFLSMQIGVDGIWWALTVSSIGMGVVLTAAFRRFRMHSI